MASRAPKQWCLSKQETINSFENWRQNLVYCLSLDANFASFLAEGVTWNKKSSREPLRGQVNDNDQVPEATRRTAQQKLSVFNMWKVFCSLSTWRAVDLTSCRGNLFTRIPQRDWLLGHKQWSRTNLCHYREYCVVPPGQRSVLYADVPSHDTVFRVAYYDMGPQSGGPVILGYHGAPGGFDDFNKVAGILCEAGARVVIPCIPGNTLTQPVGKTTYDHTTNARATFILDFMDALNLDYVDVMMSHSVGVCPSLSAAVTTDRVKSLAMFNHPGYTPVRGLRPFMLTLLVCKLLNFSFLKKATKIPLKYVVNQKGLRVDDVDVLYGVMDVAGGINFKQVRENAEKLCAKDIPMLSAVTQNDKLVEMDIPLEFVRVCGIQEDSFTYVDGNKAVVQGPSLDTPRRRRMLIFARGGHFVQNAHADMLAKCTLDLVDFVKS